MTNQTPSNAPSADHTATTSLCQRWQLSLPILQAPMAGAQDAQMAIAVSRAGGLGALPCAMLDHASFMAQTELLAQQLGRQFNLNFFCHTPVAADDEAMRQWLTRLQPEFDRWGCTPPAPQDCRAQRQPFQAQHLERVLQLRPRVVSFHFGLPQLSWVRALQAADIDVISSATTVAEALWLQQAGVNAVIAQGLEAGGHRGMFLPTGAHEPSASPVRFEADLAGQSELESLLPALLRQLAIPVIAAGGIASAADVRRAQAQGASAVQVGSAYLHCPEAKLTRWHRARLQAIQAGQRPETALTNLYTGRPARGLITPLMTRLGTLHAQAPAFPHASGALTSLRAVAEAHDDGGYAPQWCGSNPGPDHGLDAARLTRQFAGQDELQSIATPNQE